MTDQKMQQADRTWNRESDAGQNSSIDPQATRAGRKEFGNTRSSTERGAAADRALLEAGGAIVSRLRLRPVAARALAILINREEQEHGAQRAAIERALIEAAGGEEALEQLAAAERAAAEAEAAAAAQAQADAEAAERAEAEAEADAPGLARRPRLSPIENKVVALLEKMGPILGAAEVGFGLWPERDIGRQGAGGVAGRILRRIINQGYVHATLGDDGWSYRVTGSGIEAREQDRLDAIDSRQLTLLEH